jgi:DNA-nicking Smr family endonuclease
MSKTETRPLRAGPSRVTPLPRGDSMKVRSAVAPAFQVRERDGIMLGYRAELSARDRRRIDGMPGASLDLHGLDAERAQRTLFAFLIRERQKGRPRVLVIVGKGRHTAGGEGILRSQIAGWLSSTPIAVHVLGFVSAPPRLGGSGSVIVLLAGASER